MKTYVIENKNNQFYMHNTGSGKLFFYADKESFINALVRGYRRMRLLKIRYDVMDTEHKNPIAYYEDIEENIFQDTKYKYYNGYGEVIDPFFLFADEINKTIERNQRRQSPLRISAYHFEYRKEPVPRTGKRHWGYKKGSFFKQNMIDQSKDNEWRRPGRRQDKYRDERTAKWDNQRNWKNYRKHQWKEHS